MQLTAAFAATISVFLFMLAAMRMLNLRPDEARLRALGPQHSGDDEDDEEEGEEALLRRSASSIPALSVLLDTRGYAQRWTLDLERAGMTLRPGEYFLIRTGLAALAFVVAFVVARGGLLGFAIALGAAAVGYALPAFWLSSRVGRRLAKINAQLAETVMLISNAQRAGFAFSQGIDVATKRIGPPMSVELNRMLLDMNLGASTEAALHAMNERIGSDDVHMVVTAILIQRQTGGNLAEVLDHVTETMRDRDRILGEIKTLTSSQRLTGFVLSLWPVALALVFVAINPNMMSLMWTTGTGLLMLGTWLVLNAAGFFAIRRILDIDI